MGGIVTAMAGKLACMRLRSGRHLKPGIEIRAYRRAQKRRERQARRFPVERRPSDAC